jgi:hypothetical protein
MCRGKETDLKPPAQSQSNWEPHYRNWNVSHPCPNKKHMSPSTRKRNARSKKNNGGRNGIKPLLVLRLTHMHRQKISITRQPTQGILIPKDLLVTQYKWGSGPHNTNPARSEPQKHWTTVTVVRSSYTHELIAYQDEKVEYTEAFDRDNPTVVLPKPTNWHIYWRSSSNTDGTTERARLKRSEKKNRRSTLVCKNNHQSAITTDSSRA